MRREAAGGSNCAGSICVSDSRNESLYRPEIKAAPCRHAALLTGLEEVLMTAEPLGLSEALREETALPLDIEALAAKVLAARSAEGV